MILVRRKIKNNPQIKYHYKGRKLKIEKTHTDTDDFIIHYYGDFIRGRK